MATLDGDPRYYVFLVGGIDSHIGVRHSPKYPTESYIICTRVPISDTFEGDLKKELEKHYKRDLDGDLKKEQQKHYKCDLDGDPKKELEKHSKSDLYGDKNVEWYKPQQGVEGMNEAVCAFMDVAKR